MNTTGSCFDTCRKLIFFSTTHTRYVIKVSKLEKYVFQHYKVWHYKVWGMKLVSICFWKRWPQTIYKIEGFESLRGRRTPVEFVSKVRQHFFYQAIEIVANCIRNRLQQKDITETLQIMEILLLVMNFSKCLRFLVVTCINLNAGKLKTLTHTVDEKQVRIKYVIIIISSLNKSHKLLLIEVLKLVSLNSARH